MLLSGRSRRLVTEVRKNIPDPVRLPTEEEVEAIQAAAKQVSSHLSAHLIDTHIYSVTHSYTHANCNILTWLVAWHSGRMPVFRRRTFLVLRSTCS